ncbi:MAG: neutral/alkaline non-lysosomal ceramidase N-terminal domain-containing protein [Nannocystaceae bacterium]|nr:neutral/alkaline non-lysosomal ceramidase N-terminal domain-containing protein [bacterium]
MRSTNRYGLTLLLALGGCVMVEGTLAPAAAPTRPTDPAPWRVGASVVDITPPVGYGMAGHAIEAQTSVGVWTRLRAQAIAIEDREGTPLVFISADLWAIPSALPDAITQRLQTEHGLTSIGRGQVVLAATHTHHGPGHFHTAPGYADHAASEPGFDPELFEFLVTRLSRAAADAYAARRGATLDHHRVAVPSVARNRSLAPFASNPEATDLVDANAGLPGCEHPDNATWVDTGLAEDPCHAVDPTLDTLVARDANSERVIAVASFVGVHATAMPNRTPVYHGDLFGLAAQHAQSSLRDQGHAGAVVAVFNGPEGDVSPNWRAQGYAATVALGHGLGEAVTGSLRTDGQRLRGTAGYAFARAPMSNVEVTAPTTVAPGRTGRRAFPGRSQFGGAEDGRTRLHEHGFDEGRTVARSRRKGHGAKRPALPLPLIAMAHPARHFPSSVPLGVVSLGPLSFVTLPGEFTTVLGQRIERRVSEARGVSGPTIAIGLSGEYLSYFVTPEEYDLQHYEGASMMYGRLAGEAIAQAAEDLAATPRVEDVGPFVYRGRGKTSTRALTRKLGRSARHAADAVGAAFGDGSAVTMTFEDSRPRWPATSGDTTPRVWVEVELDDGWAPLVNDESDEFITYVSRAGRGPWAWTVRWLEPFAPLELRDAPLRLRVRRVDGTEVCSARFDGRPNVAGTREVAARDCSADASSQGEHSALMPFSTQSGPRSG